MRLSHETLSLHKQDLMTSIAFLFGCSETLFLYSLFVLFRSLVSFYIAQRSDTFSIYLFVVFRSPTASIYIYFFGVAKDTCFGVFGARRPYRRPGCVSMRRGRVWTSPVLTRVDVLGDPRNSPESHIYIYIYIRFPGRRPGFL